MKEDIFNVIYCMIEDYEKYTFEKPYVILISPKAYIKLREYLEDTNAWRYLTKIEKDKDKISYIFGVPIEISKIIIQEVILTNKKDYENYCMEKYYIENVLKEYRV